ncbi:MAG: hypothetical protein QXH55_05760 [Candidatus Korarchaeota archaeon]|nr:hypothetical protein [Thermoproteota archaeon]
MSESVGTVDSSKVSVFRGKTFRTQIPAKVVEWLQLRDGDTIIWRLQEKDGKKVIMLEKLE